MKLLNKLFLPIKNFFIFFSKESIDENKSLKTDKKSKKISKELFEKLKYPHFQKTPILVLFLTLVITINLILFLLSYVIDSKILNETNLGLHVILFSNHPDSVTVNHEYWRLFTFFLAENMTNWWEVLFSLFFIWIVFVRISYFQETIIGSKRTAFVWIIGILLVGIFQVFLTKHDSVFYYGTKHLSWISMGSLFFVYVFKTKKNEQLKFLVRRLLITNFLILAIFEILQYQSFSKDIISSPLSFLPENYILFPMLCLFLGFILNLSFEFKELPQVSQYIILILFLIFLILIIVFGYYKFSKDNVISTKTAEEINGILKKIFKKIN